MERSDIQEKGRGRTDEEEGQVRGMKEKLNWSRIQEKGERGERRGKAESGDEGERKKGKGEKKRDTREREGRRMRGKGR